MFFLAIESLAIVEQIVKDIITKARNFLNILVMQNLLKKVIIFLLVNFISLKSTTTHAEDFNQKSPIRIRSDIIDIKQKTHKIDFLNNVIIESEDSSLLSKKLTLFYRPKNPAGDQNMSKVNSSSFLIKEIKAYGDVKLFNRDIVASSDLGTFYPDKNSVILEKNVIVNNGTSVLTGDKFFYNTKTKKGDFIGAVKKTKQNNNNDDRVTVILGNDLKEINKKNNNDQNIKR